MAAKSLIGREVDVKQYYVKRAIRILPLYYLIILFYFITENLLWRNNIPIDTYSLYWLRYIFLLNGFVGSDTYFWSNLGITWTIPIFVFFYLVAPWICKNIKTVKNAFVLFAASLVLAFLCNTIEMLNSLNVIIYFPFFTIGILVYTVERKNCSHWLICIFASAVTFFVVMGTMKDYVYAFLMAIVLISLNDSLRGISGNAIVDEIDKCTFTFYLAHGIVFCGVIDKLGMPIALRACVALLGSVFLTVFIHYCFERPVTASLTKRLVNKKENMADEGISNRS